MFEFAVWYDGMIIGYVRGDTLRKAQNLANKMYTGVVTVKTLD